MDGGRCISAPPQYGNRRPIVHYWALFTAVIVFGVKYYTSVEMRKLERRLNKVKEDLHLAKDKHSQAQDGQNNVQKEEILFEERVRRMKETIEDLQVRLTSKDDDGQEEVVVVDSAPPPRF
jgi:hypothetical protein